MDYVRLKRMVIIGVAMSLALTAGVTGTHSISRQAFANELRAAGITTYRAGGPWSAQIVERELVSPGVYRTVRSRVSVRDGNTYRVDMTEVDETGRDVKSTTVRKGNTVHSVIRDGAGRTRVHVLENVPPDLSALLDNTLGQRLRNLAESEGGRALGRERVRDKSAIKMRIAPEHFVWLDEESGLPCKEQFLSENTIIHETEFLDYESTCADESLFDLPAPSGDTVVREDLGFRESTPGKSATRTLGFAPLPVAAPAGWTLLTGGYTDGSLRAEGGAGEPSWIELFSSEDGVVLVSQHRAFGTSVTDPRFDSGRSLSQSSLEGRRVHYHEGEWMTHAFVELDDRVVSFEAAAPFEVLAGFIESVL